MRMMYACRQTMTKLSAPACFRCADISEQCPSGGDECTNGGTCVVVSDFRQLCLCADGFSSANDGCATNLGQLPTLSTFNLTGYVSLISEKLLQHVFVNICAEAA